MILKLALRKKDGALKEWFIRARDEDLNVSHVISKAVEYYVNTRDYLQIGTVETENHAENMVKNIYYQKGAFLDGQITEWQDKGIHPSSEVKRILRKSIILSDKTTIISEIDAYDAVEAIPVIKKDSYVRQENNNKKITEQKPAQNSVKKTEKKETTVSRTANTSGAIPPSNFVTSMIAAGCGLGED